MQKMLEKDKFNIRRKDFYVIFLLASGLIIFTCFCFLDSAEAVSKYFWKSFSIFAYSETLSIPESLPPQPTRTTFSLLISASHTNETNLKTLKVINFFEIKMNRNLPNNGRFVNKYNNVTIANDYPKPSPIFSDKRNFGQIFGKSEKRKASNERVDMSKMVSTATQTDPNSQTKAWATADAFLSQQIRLNTVLIRNCYNLTHKDGINNAKNVLTDKEFLKFKKEALEFAEDQQPVTNEKFKKLDKKIDQINLYLKVITERIQGQFDDRCNQLKKEFDKVERLQESKIFNLIFVLGMIIDNKLIMEGSELDDMIKKNISLAQTPVDKSDLQIVVKNAQENQICIPKKVTEEIIETVVVTKNVTEEIIEEEIIGLEVEELD